VFRELLRERLADWVVLTDEQVAALEAHWTLLERWNRSLNLTTITNPAEAVERHYAESLFVGGALDTSPARIADIGSGPGFPGIPLAILRPDCSVALIESHQRKAVFLKEATRALPNVRVLAKRAEEVKESFDWVVSRAVSYEDLAGVASRLAPRVALLTGSENPPDTLQFSWNPPILLPWGKTRYLRVGRALVSRETDL